MALPTRACGLVIFRRFKDSVEYLLMQTSYGIHHWTPPKGHVDPGESDFETALRETEEESGLINNDLKIFKDVKVELKYNVNKKPKIVIYWLAELINQDKSVRLSKEHISFKWLPLKDACVLANYEDLQNALIQFDNYIIENIIKK